MRSHPRILVVDDVPEEHLRVRRHAEAEGFEAEWVRVGTREELARALADGTWDVLLTERGVSGLEVEDVLECLGVARSEATVLVVSRWPEDAQAGRWLRRGVRDYVGKENLVRLVPVLSRVVAEAGSRTVWAHEVDVGRVVFDAVSAEMAVLDRDGRILSTNAAWDRFAFEHPCREGRPLRACGVGADYLAVCREARGDGAEDARQVREGLVAVIEGRLPAYRHEYACDDDSGPHWFAMSVVPLGGGGRVLVSHEEITGWRTAERRLREGEARIRALIEFSPDGVIVADRARRTIQFANETVVRMLGYSAGELDRQPLEVLHPESELPRMAAELETLERQGRLVATSVTLRRKDGTLFPADISGGRFEVDGTGYWIGTFRDVTEREGARKRERIQHDLMQALAATGRLEDGLQLCLDAAIRADGLDCGAIYLGEPSTKTLQLAVHQGLAAEFVQKAARLGEGDALYWLAAVGEPVYTRFERVRFPRAGEGLEEGLGAVAVVPIIPRGRLLGCLVVASHAPGEVLPAARLVLETIAAGASQAILRLHAQEVLRASEEKHRGIFDESVAAIFVFDRDKHFRDANQAGLDLLGYSREELLGLGIPDVDADPTAVLPAHGQLLEGGRLINYEHRLWRKDGGIVTVLNNSRPLTDADGQVTGIQSTLVDITERRRAERLQALSSEVLRILGDAQSTTSAARQLLEVIRRDLDVDAVGIRLKEGEDFPYEVAEGFSDDFLAAENSLTVRDAQGSYCLDAEGRPRLECTCGLVLSGRTDPDHPLFTTYGSAWTNDARPLLDLPPDRDPRLHPRNRCIREGYRSIALVPIRTGEVILGLLQLNDRRPGRFTPESIRFFEGLAASFGVALTRLRSERAVVHSQRALRALFDAIPESLFLMDCRGTIREANRGFANRFGRQVEDVVGESLFELLPGELAESRRAWIDEVVSTRRLVVQEELWGERWLRHHYCPALGSEGRVDGIVAYAVDITERKQAEAELRQWANAFENCAHGIALGVPGTNRVHACNPAFARMLGRRVGDLQGTPILDLYVKEDHGRVRAWIATADREGQIRYESRMIRADGSSFPVQMDVVSVRDEAGVTLYRVVTAQDIGERLEAEETLRRSLALQDQLAKVANTVPGMIYTFRLAPDGSASLPFCTRTVEDVWGFGSEVLRDDMAQAFQRIHPDDLPGLMASIQESARTLAPWRGDFRVFHPDRGELWVEGHSLPRREEDGSVVWHGFMHDVTDSKRAEAEARLQEARLRLALEAADLVTWELDAATGRLSYSSNLAAMSGAADLSPYLSLREFEEQLHPDDRERAREAIGRTLASGEPFACEYRVRLPDGSWRWLAGQGRAVLRDDGRVAQVLGVSQDITARKALEDQREAALIKYRTLFDSLPLGVTVADRQGRIVEYNRGAEQILGLREWGDARLGIVGPESTLIRPDGSPLPPDELPSVQALRDGKVVRDAEMGLARAGGEVLWISVTAAPLSLPELGVVVTLADVTERRRWSETLAEEAARRRVLFEGSMDGIVVVNQRGGVFEANRRFAEMLGYTDEEIRKLSVWDWDCSWTREQVLEAIVRDQGGAHFETRHRRKDGTEFDVEITSNGALVGGQILVFCVCRNITDRKRLEEELRQAQKLEAVGHLAGGVAHDFNNILAAMMMQLGLLRMDPGLDEDMRQAVKDLDAEARRAASLTRQLLMFSRRSMLEIRPLDLNELVRNLLKMLGRLIGEHIRLEFEPYMGDLPAVAGDPGMIEQVVLNLVVNARDAMPRGGRLTLGLQVEQVEPDRLPPAATIPPGRFVRLSVADSGVGMSEEIRQHIFEPFFTTKEPGKGSGLGLATVHGIVAQHKGWVEVESEPGQGSVFRVYLPAATEASAPLAEDATASGSLHRGRETILVVEDEAKVRLG